MDGLQIKKILSSLPETSTYFFGVFANSYVPEGFFNLNNGFIIINTLKENESAQEIGHWIGFALQTPNRLLFFDSLGHHPSFYEGEINRIFSGFVGEKTIVFNRMLQSIDSYTCGGFVVYFCFMMSQNKSLYTIRNKFGRNKKINDKFVREFIAKTTGVSLKCNKEFCPSYMFMTSCSKYCCC